MCRRTLSKSRLRPLCIPSWSAFVVGGAECRVLGQVLFFRGSGSTLNKCLLGNGCITTRIACTAKHYTP